MNLTEIIPNRINMDSHRQIVFTLASGQETVTILIDTVCPKLFGTPKMYQNGPQMSNKCAQLPLHTGLYIHG